MFDFCSLNRRQRINLRNRTERLRWAIEAASGSADAHALVLLRSDLLGWDLLQDYYYHARMKALHRVFPSDYHNPDASSSDAFRVCWGCLWS